MGTLPIIIKKSSCSICGNLLFSFDPLFCHWFLHKGSLFIQFEELYVFRVLLRFLTFRRRKFRGDAFCGRTKIAKSKYRTAIAFILIFAFAHGPKFWDLGLCFSLVKVTLSTCHEWLLHTPCTLRLILGSDWLRLYFFLVDWLDYF